MADPVARLNAALEGRYRVERQLGEGGMATVYLADDLRHSRKVALKVLKPELAAALGPERFLQEIRIAAKLQHPHILPLHDSGVVEDLLYYVMPYVAGETLHERLRREGELPIGDAIRILRDIVDALTEAHAQGIVHRDIKPANVLLSGRHALVTDFGVAKAVSEATGRQNLTTVGVSLGTPAYMAPEQAAADPNLDHRVDIYAVGVMAYELLAGRRPFEAATARQLLAAQMIETPRAITDHRSAVPPALAAAVMRCLERRPADRWQSAEALLTQIESVATTSGEITPARVPVGTASQPLRRASLIAVGGVVLAGLAAAFVLRGAGDPDGPPPLARVRQLTARPLDRALTGASISTDGRYLAYADPTGLHVLNVGTGELVSRALPEELEVRDVGWFPDGTRLFFLGIRLGTLDLYSIPLLGGEPTLLLEAVVKAAMAPDGSRFAVRRGGPGSGSSFDAVWSVGPRGESPRVVVQSDEGEAPWDVAWAPDSRHLAVGFTSEGSPAIDAISIEDGSRTTLLEDPRLFQNWTGILPFTWCADGRLVYALTDGSRVDATSNVWIVETDLERGTASGTPRRLTQEFGSNVRDLSATADCSVIAAMRVENQADVWVAELLDGGRSLGEATQVTFDEREDFPRSWMGDDLILVTAMAGGQDLYRWRPGSPTVQPFVVSEGIVLGGEWDARARRFLYSSGGRLWAAGPEGGIGTQLREDGAGTIECASLGGCVKGQRQGADYVFYSIDAASGEQTELARIDFRPPFANFAVSPDGSTVAVVHNNDDVIRFVDLTSGEERSLEVAGWAHFEFVSWSVDGQRLFVNAGYASSGGYPVLLAVELDGSASLLRRAANVWHVMPTASPSGRYLAFATMPFQGNAYLLTDF